MRYYKIVLADPDTGAALLPGSLKGLPLSSLLPDGSFNPAALQVELDIPVGAYHLPDGNAIVRIWGLGLQDIGSSFNLNPQPQAQKQGAIVTVYGGMSKGLPLANPAQARILVKGQVYQAFGNWLGTEQTVDLILAPPTQGSAFSNVNYSLDWKKGTPLEQALKTCLSAALPSAELLIKISPNLVMNYDQPAYYGSLTQLNQFLNSLSRSIVTDAGYQGVTIAYDGARVTISDGTQTPGTTTRIAFQDLVGQPTWIDVNTIQVKCVMRGDIALQDQITLPPSIVTSTSGAFQGQTGNNPANNLTFNGPYLVTKIHHYGNFRQPDAMSWNTTIDAIKPPQQQQAA